MLKCSIFLPFSLEIKTESNTHFSVECHTKILVCFLMSKYSSLRNQKRAVKGASFFTILKGYFSRSQGHKLGYDLET